MPHPTNASAPAVDNAMRLMLDALILLDKAGASLAACKLQHAIDIVRGTPQDLG